MVSQSTSKAAELSTRAVGSVTEIGGAVASVAAVKRQCLDTEFKEGLPGRKVGLMPCEDESSSDQVDWLATAGLWASQGKRDVITDTCDQVARPALVAKNVSATSQRQGQVGPLKTDATE